MCASGAAAVQGVHETVHESRVSEKARPQVSSHRTHAASMQIPALTGGQGSPVHIRTHTHHAHTHTLVYLPDNLETTAAMLSM